MFILNLDEFTFDEYSTESGAFASQPDQIVSILRNEHYESGALIQKDRHLLYFCEDGGEKCGIHGRDEQGRFYTIVQARDPRLWGETTGLAFSPVSVRFGTSDEKIAKMDLFYSRPVLNVFQILFHVTIGLQTHVLVIPKSRSHCGNSPGRWVSLQWRPAGYQISPGRRRQQF